jgi:cytochrome c551/c552
VIFLSLLAGFVLLFQLPSVWSPAADTAPAAPAKLVPGLTLSLTGSTGAVDVRDARLVALLVPAGTPASPFVPAGGFTAKWTGILNTRIKDTYRFAAEGRGELTVTINEKPVLNLQGDFTGKPAEPVVVRKGKNRIVVTYTAPAEGDAIVRLLWAAEGKPFEPIAPTVFTHDWADDLLVMHTKIRAGRELVGSMRCMNCHQGISGLMPELKADAPNLADLGKRLRPAWIAAWITNPKNLRPTASMPRVLHDNAGVQSADIAEYLTSGSAAADSPVITDPVVLARGARLFTGLGCVACHVAPGIADSDPSLNRIPLKYVKEKFAGDGLREFLKKPEAHYAWIKMPNFRLSDDESTALSAWLLSRCKDNLIPPLPSAANAAKGKALFEASGCLSCHAVGNSTPKPATVMDLSRADWTRGCAAGIGKGVDYGFTAEQTEALRAFAATDWKPSLDRDPPAEFATRQMAALRCNACHSIDGADNTWSNLDSEVGAIEQDLPPRPPSGETKAGDASALKDKSGQISVDVEPAGDQSRPPLTWTGEKLRPSWMASFIAGKIAYKPRTWLFARMPGFASRGERLARGMAMAQGCPVTDEARPAIDPHLAEIGRSLTSQTSFGCVKCHSAGDQAAIAPFEAYAPNLAHVSDRLRHEYFTHWMRNPQYYLPGTKMPSFADADGNTAYRDILGGDAARQYEAIWNYLLAGEKIAPAQ